ncbi:hypothetical protein BDZ94DRAFT_1272667 [Collybia nuda]|uniref:Uncharacterized protein n=1 Tax=Collybia nuda TaxID=64659 RepID=A0A9P6CE42_9AGAR|nr:hypothetical protein BDZ94DRAFT_1272667 [Collybia nuda]
MVPLTLLWCVDTTRGPPTKISINHDIITTTLETSGNPSVTRVVETTQEMGGRPNINKVFRVKKCHVCPYQPQGREVTVKVVIVPLPSHPQLSLVRRTLRTL